MTKKNRSSNSIKKSKLKNKENLNINKIIKDSKNESLKNNLKNNE